MDKVTIDYEYYNKLLKYEDILIQIRKILEELIEFNLEGYKNTKNNNFLISRDDYWSILNKMNELEGKEK